MSSQVRIGIHLGTTNVRISYVRNRNLLPDWMREFPTCISYTEGKFVVGYVAKCRIISHPKSTIYDVMRIIGRRFDDPAVAEFAKTVGYSIVERNGLPVIEIPDNDGKGNTTIVTPEYVLSVVLNEAKFRILEDLGVSYAPEVVITVPAAFNHVQRASIVTAASSAGLFVKALVPEPIAAVLCYCKRLGLTAGESRNILVCNFDRTFDVAIMAATAVKAMDPNAGEDVVKMMFVPRAITSDAHLGSDDINKALFDYVASAFMMVYGKDFRQSGRACAIIQKEVEEAKECLSNLEQIDTSVEFHYDGKDYELGICECDFNYIISPVICRCMVDVDRAFAIAKMTKEDINNVVLVGGSSRIPLYRRMLQDYFPHLKLDFSVDSDEAIANGAALYSACFDMQTVQYENVSVPVGAFDAPRKNNPINQKEHRPSGLIRLDGEN